MFYESVLIIILLALAGLTSASETSITAVSRVKLRRLASSGSQQAKKLLKILETPERFFGAILVSNNAVSVLLASIVTAMMIILLQDEGKGVLAATVIVTLTMIVFEVTVKSVAARNSEKVSLALSGATASLISLLAPIANILAHFTSFASRLFGIKTPSRPSLLTAEEIRSLITLSEEDGAIARDQGKMLSKVFDFGSTLVRNVMTPKAVIVMLDVKAKYEDIMKTVLDSGYSRLPVYSETEDNVIGIVNVKDLLNFWEHKELIILQDMVFLPMYVAGSRKVSELLKEFQKGNAHMAVVVDLLGKIEGLVTLEDLLEEIVGEIADEYDVRKPEMERLAEDRYLLNDRCRLKKLNRELGLTLPDKAYVTIGSYIRGALKRMPAVNEEVVCDTWTCVVKKVEGHRITEIEMIRRPSVPPSLEAPQAPGK